MTQVVRTAGIDVWVETPLDREYLDLTLRRMADETAFRLDEVYRSTHETENNALPGPLRRYCCRFMLKAVFGTTGDAQVFDLLRRLGLCHRWIQLEKLIEGAHGEVIGMGSLAGGSAACELAGDRGGIGRVG